MIKILALKNIGCRLKRHALFAFAMLTFIACTDKNPDSENGPFDRQAMLANYADNIIIPAYTSLSLKVASLQQNATVLTENPTLQNLESAQNAWLSAYIEWQYANAFNFGPAGEEGLRKGLIAEIGTFPVNESKMEAALSSGNYNLEDFNRDARGFFAVEYLLFYPSGDQDAIVSRFDGAFDSQLLKDLIQNIDSRINDVLAEWNGGFRDSFVANNGTDVGSSTSKFYNEFVRSFEAIKNFKLALPLGLRPGQISAEPNLVEAYYSRYSAEGLQANIQNMENLWYGRSRDGMDGLGFDDYLATVTGGKALIEATKMQLANINTFSAALPIAPPLAIQVLESPEPASNLHTELQRNTRYFKSDMSSLLGLAITFSSSDGD